MIAEDDKKLNELISDILKKNGFQVDSVFSAAEANNKINKNNDYQIVILDMVFVNEGLNGLDLLRAAKEKSSPPNVIIITGKQDDLDSRVEGLDQGADLYLSKPFDSEELLAFVKAILRGREKFTPKQDKDNDPVKIGPVVFNRKNYTLNCLKQQIGLSRKEYEILNFFLKNKNKNLTHDEVARAVWGKVFSKDASNTLIVHIWNLRQKLGPAAKKLKTVAKNKYRLS